MNASRMLSRESVRTRTPRFGSKETRPSAASRRSASRTGVRLTAYRSECCSWRRTAPGGSSPATIASSIARAMSSAFVPAPSIGLAVFPCSAVSVKSLVRRQRQELDEAGRKRELGEQFLRLRPGLDARELGAHLVLREPAGAQPAPDLRARDLCGRRVLHLVVDRRGADAAEPRVEVPRA